MKVPFVDLPKQIAPYSDEIRRVIDDVVFKRADFVMRDDLLEFEKKFAKFVGTKYAIGVANGSDSLNLSMKALGIGPGDEVITVSHTFVATIAAIVHAGATPVLIDVADDYNMDVDKIRNAITAKTKAIIPVHLNGRLCAMDQIEEIAKKHKLYIIEDSAQAIGAKLNGRAAGTWGHLSSNSFYPFKILGCLGDGGALTTDDANLNYKLRCLRDNGQNRLKGEILDWGWNSRLDNLQAAILIVMLKHLPVLISRRRKIAKLYQKGLCGTPGLTLPPAPENKNYYDVFQNYVIRTQKRDEIVSFLSKAGVGTLISWPKPTHHHKNLGLTNFHLPNTERISREVVSLPMHPAITDEEAQYIVQTIQKFFS